MDSQEFPVVIDTNRTEISSEVVSKERILDKKTEGLAGANAELNTLKKELTASDEEDQEKIAKIRDEIKNYEALITVSTRFLEEDKNRPDSFYAEQYKERVDEAREREDILRLPFSFLTKDELEILSSNEHSQDVLNYQAAIESFRTSGAQYYRTMSLFQKCGMALTAARVRGNDVDDAEREAFEFNANNRAGLLRDGEYFFKAKQYLAERHDKLTKLLEELVDVSDQKPYKEVNSLQKVDDKKKPGLMARTIEKLRKAS